MNKSFTRSPAEIQTTHATRINIDLLPRALDGHRRLAAEVEAWAARELGGPAPADPDAHCRAVVRKLGEAGWIAHPMPAAFGGAREGIDVRALCLVREVLSRHDPLAAFAYAMQGLGTAPML